MGFPYKTVLIIGCTAGIGVALAERMIENGIFVIAVGRRKERLDAFVAKHGSDKVAVSQFDITNLDAIQGWVGNITKTHPQIDSIVLNSGIQRALNFTQPSNIDLGRVQLELTTNYTSYIYLLTHLLPHLQSLTPRRPASIIAVSSGLAVVPLPRCANYCASKAALHSLMWSLRAQLANDEGSRHIKVVEVLPPAVQTELHELQEELRAKGQTNFGMPLDEFTDECWEGLVRGDKEVPVGATKERFGGEEERRRVFERVVELMGTT